MQQTGEYKTVGVCGTIKTALKYYLKRLFNSAPDYLLYDEIKDDIKAVRDEETGEISDVLELWLQPTLFDGSNAKQSLGIVHRYYAA